MQHISSLKQHVNLLQDNLLDGRTLAPWLDGIAES